MRILAYYLPQFHRIKENDEWWGDGYTEWTAVKNAKALYKWHKQPVEPLDNHYYDLCDNGKTWRWQADLAKKYGVDGFAIYHYWSNGKLLLEKPAELLLKDKSIDVEYCFIWANHPWTRIWYSKKDEMLWPQLYDKKGDIIDHFKYLTPFFKDSRYIKINNKPVVGFYDTKSIPNIQLLIRAWDNEARKIGFNGVFFLSSLNSMSIDDRSSLFDAYCICEPNFTISHNNSFFVKSFNYVRKVVGSIFKKDTPYLVNDNFIRNKIIKSYNQIKTRLDKPVYPSYYTSWDNTPRRGSKGTIYYNNTPNNFGLLLKVLTQHLGDKDFCFINAWNEWGEGCHLEPDKNNNYLYLEEVKKLKI